MNTIRFTKEDIIEMAERTAKILEESQEQAPFANVRTRFAGSPKSKLNANAQPWATYEPRTNEPGLNHPFLMRMEDGTICYAVHMANNGSYRITNANGTQEIPEAQMTSFQFLYL